MGDWKLIERFEDGKVHLYDLSKDIGERNGVAAKHPDRCPPCAETARLVRKRTPSSSTKSPDGPRPYGPIRSLLMPASANGLPELRQGRLLLCAALGTALWMIPFPRGWKRRLGVASGCSRPPFLPY